MSGGQTTLTVRVRPGTDPASVDLGVTGFDETAVSVEIMAATHARGGVWRVTTDDVKAHALASALRHLPFVVSVDVD